MQGVCTKLNRLILCAITELYRPKGEYERRFTSIDSPASHGNQNSGLKQIDLKGVNSPTFGVSLNELKDAVNQRLETSSDAKKELAAKDSGR